jgi:hypothetical protein
MGRASDRTGRAPRVRILIVVAALVTLAGLTGAVSVATPPASALGPLTVTMLSPNSLPQGVAALTVTVTGTNFVPGATVTSHAGITATATFVNSTQLDLLMDVARTVPTGTYNVFVTNPDDHAVGTCNNCLTVTVGTSPTVTSLNPSSFPPGVSTQAVTLSGTNFVSGATFSSHAGITATVTFVNSSQLNLSLTIAPTVPSGLYDVFVTNPDHSLGSCINCLSIGAQVSNPSGPFVGIASRSDGTGYWLANAAGGVFPRGSAVNYGSMAGQPLNAPVTHIVSTPDGLGYWLVAGDGGTFTFGDAGFYGSMGGRQLNAPVVDIAPTASGRGYWLVASDGGIFSFGDAQFFGSMGGQHLNQPVVGMSEDNATGGYWLVASDGGIFSFGAPFFGSTGGFALNKPVNGMAATATSQGYWLVASDGGIFSFGDAGFHGSAGGIHLNAPIVGMAPDWASGGYWLVGSDGGVFSFGAPFFGAG